MEKRDSGVETNREDWVGQTAYNGTPYYSDRGEVSRAGVYFK